MRRIGLLSFMLLLVLLITPIRAVYADNALLARDKVRIAVLFNLSKPLDTYTLHHPFMVSFQKVLAKHPQAGMTYYFVEQSLDNNTYLNLQTHMGSDTMQAFKQAIDYLQKFRGEKKIWLVTDQDILTMSDPIIKAKQVDTLMGSLLSQLLEASVEFNTLVLQPFAESNLILSMTQKTQGQFEVDGKHSIRQTIPILNNQFVVDKALSEIIIMFEGDRQVTLSLPDGKNMTIDSKDDQLYWRFEQNHHTVSVKKPQEGIWQINGSVENIRVEYLSGLSLVVEAIPQNIFLGEINELYASMAEKNERITREEFIDYMQMYAMIKNEAVEEANRIDLNDAGEGMDELPSDGLFSTNFAILDLPGVYDITVYANALGIKRKHHQKVFVHNYPVNLIPDYDLETKNLIINARLNTPLLAANEIELAMRVNKEGGDIKNWAFEKSKKGYWQVTTQLNSVHDIKQLSFHVTAKTRGGRLVHIILPQLDIDQVYQQAQQKATEKLLALLRADNPWLGEALLFSNERRKDKMLKRLKEKYPRLMTYWQPRYASYDQELIKAARAHLAQESMDEAAVLEDNLAAIDYPGIEVIQINDLSKNAQVTLPEVTEPETQESVLEGQDKEAKKEEVKAATKETAQEGSGVLFWILLFLTVLMTLSTMVGGAVLLRMRMQSRALPETTAETAESAKPEQAQGSEEPTAESSEPAKPEQVEESEETTAESTVSAEAGQVEAAGEATAESTESAETDLSNVADEEEKESQQKPPSSEQPPPEPPNQSPG